MADPQPITTMPVGDVRRFLLACVPRARGEEVTLGAMYRRYQRWCDDTNCAALDINAFGQAFKVIAKRHHGLRIRRDGDKVYCLDVKLVA